MYLVSVHSRFLYEKSILYIYINIYLYIMKHDDIVFEVDIDTFHRLAVYPL